LKVLSVRSKLNIAKQFKIVRIYCHFPC